MSIEDTSVTDSKAGTMGTVLEVKPEVLSSKGSKRQFAISVGESCMVQLGSGATVVGEVSPGVAGISLFKATVMKIGSSDNGTIYLVKNKSIMGRAVIPVSLDGMVHGADMLCEIAMATEDMSDLDLLKTQDALGFKEGNSIKVARLWFENFFSGCIETSIKDSKTMPPKKKNNRTIPTPDDKQAAAAVLSHRLFGSLFS